MNTLNEPYTPPSADLATPNVPVRYTGFWVRVGATMLDGIWQMPIIFALGFLVCGEDYFNSTLGIKGPVDYVLQFFLPFILVMGFWLKNPLHRAKWRLIV